MRVGGHYWTLRGHLGRHLAARSAPPSTPCSLVVDDPRYGPIHLTSRLSHPTAAETLLIVIHGVGGCAESSYAMTMACAAQSRGLAVLRVNLRGADRRGEDIYHGGLTADLDAFVAMPAVERFRDIVVVGYSLGGHLALRWATEALDPRVRAVAAVCPPLDLLSCAEAIDRPSGRLYRGHILRQLKEIYGQVAVRRELPAPVEEVRRVRSMIHFDDLTVAPRHGFINARDYYAKMSVGKRLAQLRVPALIVEAVADPMVPAAGIRPFLDPAPPAVTVHWARRGGHIGFPRGLDLGVTAAPGLDSQVLAWLARSTEVARHGDPPAEDAICSELSGHA